MEKTIKIDSKTRMKLSNNIGWTMAYRAQFGHDIIPVVMPIISSMLTLAQSAMEDLDGEELTIASLTKISPETITEALIQASSLEFVSFVNIVWAMAKSADEEIEEPTEWVKQFSTFPVDIIAPQVWDLALSGMVSTKNLKRLQDLTKNLKPTESSKSSSAEQPED